MDLGFKPKNYGHVEELPTDAVLTLAIQLHNAHKAKEHSDLRIGNESGMYSWALPKHLPQKPGEKRLAIQTPIHSYAYSTGFEGNIPEGNYGAGTVKIQEKGPVVVLKATPNHVVFTRGTSQDSPVYNMVKTKGDNWIVSIKEEGQPTAVLRYKKGHFPSVPIDQIADIIDQGARVRAKIDGSSVLAYLGKNGIRAFGTRVGANGMRPEYTSILGPEIRNAQVPKELQGRLIRGELYGVRNGRPIHPNELSGLLHSNLANAVDMKQKRGIHLLIAALAENKNGVDDWYTGADDLVAQLNNPSIHGMSPVTGEAAKRFVDKIVAGKYPLTREGAVLSLPNGKTIKSKKRDDFDAIIEGVFPADTKGEPRAGGFIYSLPDQPNLRARVGTGMSHSMLKDMLANPDKYIGREMRLASQERLNSGALRAPSFVAMRAD